MECAVEGVRGGKNKTALLIVFFKGLSIYLLSKKISYEDANDL